MIDPGTIASSPATAIGCRSGQVTATCVRSSAALEQLAGEWREFFRGIGCQNACLSVDWMEPWWRQWGSCHRLLVITLRNREGRLLAVAPFYIRRSRLGALGPRALCFLGNQWVASDHLNILVDPEYEQGAIEAIVCVVKEHHAEWDYIELGSIGEDSPLLTNLRQQFKNLGMKEQVLRSIICPYLPLPASFDAYLVSVSKNLRYNYRRRRRALERDAEIEFVVLQSEAELKVRFDEFVQLHRLRFKERRKYSSFLTRRMQEFFSEAFPRLAADGLVRLFLLQVNGKAVAGLFGFSTGKRFAFYQCGMDPALSRLSIGLVMMGCSIEEAIRTGHEEFDFLRGQEAYKFQWTNKSRRVVTIALFDNRLRSQLAQPYVWARECVERLVRRCILPVLGLLHAR